MKLEIIDEKKETDFGIVCEKIKRIVQETKIVKSILIFS